VIDRAKSAVVALAAVQGADTQRSATFLTATMADFTVPHRVLFFSEDASTLTGKANIRADDLRRLAIARLQGGAHAR
jgi:hypothetical protein